MGNLPRRAITAHLSVTRTLSTTTVRVREVCLDKDKGITCMETPRAIKGLALVMWTGY